MRREFQRLQRHEDKSPHHQPGLRNLLRAIGLGVEYHRAAADLLYYRDAEGVEVEVLDLVGGYGTLLLGHNHPELIAEAVRWLASNRPNHSQGSIRTGAERLAQMLSARADGDYCAVFANSGAEAVESALKHALLETGGRTLIVLDGAFHGKTSGALQLTANPRYRGPFVAESVDVVRVRPNGLDQLRTAFADVSNPAGFLFEPVQGEAGVRPLTEAFVQQAAALCRERGIPLIADECQTGLGRAGDFLASHTLGVRPDYVILSKALGGGLAKISALLIRRDRYLSDFDLLHSSTYAADEMSSAVALRVLELVDATCLDQIRSLGADLLARLEQLRVQYPAAIKEVRGRGLMLGIELNRPVEADGYLLNFLTAQELLAPLAAGYLLREQRIRIAPTLSDPWTLRIQPSVLLRPKHVDWVVSALQKLCEKLCERDVAGLTRFLTQPTTIVGTAARLPAADTWESPPRLATSHHRGSDFAGQRRTPRRRVAWLFHFIDENDLVHLEPLLSEFSPVQRAAFLERTAALVDPVVFDEVDIQSGDGETVRLVPILLPVTSQWLLQRRSGRGRRRARFLIQQGIDLAAARQCQVVSLGQFTSTVTHGGTHLSDRGLCLTSGNSYPAALVAQSIDKAVAERDLDRRELTLAVIGAAGDIGRTCTRLLAAGFRRSILIGSGHTRSHRQLARLAREINRSESATDFAAIRCADVVVCATSSLNAPLGPEHIHPRAIVCDVSVPSSLKPGTKDRLPDVTMLPGALVELPGGEDLRIPGYPLAPGLAYGCMAEGLLLGLEGVGSGQWHGPSLSERAVRIAEIAAAHGFQAAKSERVHWPLEMTHASIHGTCR